METNKKDYAGIIGGYLFAYSIISVFIQAGIIIINMIGNFNLQEYPFSGVLFILWFMSSFIGFFVAPFIVMKSKDYELKRAVADVFRSPF